MITIVIMLILVGVTVNIAIDGNLFNKAGEAVDKTNAKVGKLQQDVDYYAGQLNDVSDRANEVEHNWTRNEETFKCLNCRRELKMGQQIMYTDSGESSTIVTAAKSGSTSDQTITKPSNIRWVVFGIEDNDGNGTNESLLITTVEPVSGPDFEDFYVYNNGEEELNRVCRELYGSNARSMTLADIENTLQYRPSGAMYGIVKEVNLLAENSNLNQTVGIQRTSLKIGMVIQHNLTALNANIEYRTTGNFTTKLNQLEIWNEIKTSGADTPDGANTEAELGKYTLNSYVYSVASDGKITNPVKNETQNISKITRDLIFGTYNNYSYSLGSKAIGATTSGASFGLANIGSGETRNLPNRVLIKAGQSMLAQANQSNQGVLGTNKDEETNNSDNNNASSGSKINRAGDDASGLAISSQIRGLNGSIRPVIRITNELLSIGGVIQEYGEKLPTLDLLQ